MSLDILCISSNLSLLEVFISQPQSLGELGEFLCTFSHGVSRLVIGCPNEP